MDHSPPTSFQDKLHKLRDICRTRGLRLTPQRLEIFREIAMKRNHPSVEDVYRRLQSRMPTISLDTVYRTLTTLESIGVIARLQVLDDRVRYDGQPAPHCHLVCVLCKSVTDCYSLPPERTSLPPDVQEWGIVNSKHVEFRGTCKKCLKEEQRKG